MNKRFLGNFFLLLAIGLGLLTGWADVPFLNKTAEVVSDLFLRLLKLISLPVIFLAITSTISGMKDIQEMRRLGRKILLYTLGTTLVAAIVALCIYLLVDPVKAPLAIEESAFVEAPRQASYISFVRNIIPSNFFEAFTEGNVIGIVFIALLLSVATLFLPEKQKTFLNQLFSSLFEATIKVTGFAIYLMRIAIWAFMTLLITDLRQNHEHFSRLMLYILCILGANVFQGVVVLPLILKFKKISPWKSFRGMLPALMVAFFTKSSNAALPVTLKSAENNLGISKRISSFTFPLCSVVNMNGCAAFILITVLFVSTVHGITFSAFDLIGWIFLSTLAAIGNAGVPMGCFFLTSAFLIGMNVPLYMMGLILPFYTLLDMIETTLNVWSDACITISVDKDLSKAEEQLPQQSKTTA
ncbi:MAG: dicarboxylate/amino acid:cation symporter [Chlamydiales bacterium]